jgi:hypothetical protein
MLNRREHALFIVRVLDLLHLHDTFLVQNFDGIISQIMFAANCSISVARLVQAQVKDTQPRCTRPKLPVPSVR